MPDRSIPTSPPSKPTPIAEGLVYVNPDMPGIRRLKAGTKFRYRDAHGRWVSDPDELSRIRMLAIPPAYTEVWICPLPNGHLQATGIDARGRKQYRYHADWRLFKDETKFERLEAFGLALPRIRARVARDLQEGSANRTPSRQQVLAALVRLLDTTLLRVGNEEYASTNKSYGLTTLRNRHASVRGAALRLNFRGKSGVMHEALLDDPRVAKVVRQCQQLPGQALFQYRDDDEAQTLHSVSSTDVNDYLADASPGERFTAKDFRTWHGTVQALELTRLACEPGRVAADGSRYTPKEILTAVAKQLGNTPAVCKKAYVHPAVLALGSALAGDEEDPSAEVLRKMSARTASQRTRGLHAAEQRLLAFLRINRQRLVREMREAQKNKTRVKKATAAAKASPGATSVRAPATRRAPRQPAARAKQTLSRSSATV